MVKSQRAPLLITGASGLLGATLLHEWEGVFPDIVAAYGKYPISRGRGRSHPLDLADSNALLKFLEETRPKLIVHSAAVTNIDQCEADQGHALKVNVEATETMANWCAAEDAKMAFISTDAFFNEANRKFVEEDTPTPVNFYGETKARAERVVRDSGANHLILRTSIYGWNYQPKFSLAEWMLNRFQRRIEVPLVYDVEFNPILTNTFARGLKALLQADCAGTWHLAGSESLSKLEFGTLLCREFGYDEKLIAPKSVNDIGLTAKRSSHMALSVAKFENRFADIDLSVAAGIKQFHELKKSGYQEKLRHLG